MFILLFGEWPLIISEWSRSLRIYLFAQTHIHTQAAEMRDGKNLMLQEEVRSDRECERVLRRVRI
jgi:hypothetical protein